MSSNTGKLYADLPLPSGYEGELIANGLRSEGWEHLSYSELTDEITAKLERTDKKGDIAFTYDFRVKCRWGSLDNGAESTRVYVQITDRENQSKKYQCEKLCYQLLETVEEAGRRATQKLDSMERSTKYGADRWAEIDDLEKAGLVQKADSDGNSRNSVNGIVLGPYVPSECDDESGRDNLVIPEEQAFRHAMVCGPTGCGKTSSVFIPNIIERSQHSAIITEATAGEETPDLYSKTSGHRLKKGHSVYYFNPDDTASVRINPIEHVTKVSQAIDIASLIMKNTQNKFKTGGDKFWQDAEGHLLTSLIMHVAPEKGHLGDVRALLRYGPDKLGEVLSTSQIETAREEYRAFLNIGTDNIQKGVMIGLMQRLNSWVDPKVVALTQTNDIDFSKLKDELFTFYLAVPASKDRLKPVASLVLNYLLEMVENIQFEHKVNLFLDEFTNFGYIPGLPSKMSIIRHKKVPVMLGCQDFVQIRIEYGDDPTKAIFNNVATKVIFRSNDLMTAKNVSESLGQETVVERKLDTACNIQRDEFGRPLMRPSEVMSMDEEYSIVFNPLTYPMKVKRFHWKDYLPFTENEPHKHEPVEVDDSLQRQCEVQMEEPEWQKAVDEEKISKEVEEYEKQIESDKQDKEPEEAKSEKKQTRTEKDFDIPL